MTITPPVLTEWEPPCPAHLPPTYRKAETLPARVSDYNYDPPRETVSRVDRRDANLICSDLPDGNHMLVVDIDLPAALVPSSTPGHYHLYIGETMTWRQYKRVLRAMYRAGLIQYGFYAAAKRRGYTSVRPPWVRKTENDVLAPY